MLKMIIIALFAFVLMFANISLGEPSEMIEVGSGEVRYMGIIKVYDAALFVSEKVPGVMIQTGQISKCLKLDYAVSLTVDDFIKGAATVLQRQHSVEKINTVEKEIDMLHRSYRDVEKGDFYTLCYDASSSTTTLALNSEELVNIDSADFARLYFGIWLGPVAPLSERLRDDLLRETGGK
ncbi:MAG: chalcone isomerase family protein [Desulforhopalus sp.]